MPTFRSETLRQVGYQLFEAAGCKPGDARVVVDHLVESNLFWFMTLTVQFGLENTSVLFERAGSNLVKIPRL